MSASARPDAVPETQVKLGLNEAIELDVRYCDLVPAREANAGPYDVRFRGARRPGMERVRLYVPLSEIEGALIHEGILAASLVVQKVDRTNSQEIPLTKHALRISRRETGRGRWQYVVEGLGNVEEDAKRFLAAVTAAAEQVAPVLQRHGYAVGAAEIISIAGQLTAARHSQR